MATRKDTPEDKAEDQPAEGTTTMRFEGAAWSGKLRIGDEEIAVEDGLIQLPPRLCQAAHQAGFRPL